MDHSMTCLLDEALLTQQIQHKQSAKKCNTNQPSRKKPSPKKASKDQYSKNAFTYQAVEMPSHKKRYLEYHSHHAFTRAKLTSKPNILAGTMLEVMDDRETRQVFVANKTIEAKFVNKMMVVPIEQEIDCQFCYNKTTLCGFNAHICGCYLY
jgi:hypothetical protein